MNTSEFREKALQVSTLAEAWELSDQLFNDTTLTGEVVEYIKNQHGWTCKVVKQTVKYSGKEAVYTKKVVCQETGKTLIDSFKQAMTTYLS